MSAAFRSAHSTRPAIHAPLRSSVLPHAVSAVRPSVRLLVAAACVLALLGAGCSRSIDRALADVTRAEGGVQHDRFGDRFSFDADPAPLVPATLPADFPADIYRPDDYRLLGNADHDGLRRVQLHADGATVVLGEQARSAMLQQGWRQVMSRQQGDSQRVMAFVKQRRTAVLSFDRAGLGEVRVGVQWRPQPAGQ